MAVDGSNMVLAVKDGVDSPILHIMFYSLINDVWARTRQFKQGNYGITSVSIYGKTAFVGLQDSRGKPTPLVYEQDKFGSWSETQDPFTIGTLRQGYHVDIYGNLACVEYYYGNTYLFRREDNAKWVQFDMIANAQERQSQECSIDGDTIVTFDGGRHIWLYKYFNGGIVPLQDPIEILDGVQVFSAHLNGNNLVIAEAVDLVNKHISIYHQDEVNGTFSLLQRLNISTPWYGYVPIDKDLFGKISIDKDLLVFRRDDGQTHIFSEQNGYWVETLIFDETYDSCKLSDRNLLAWDGATEIHYYNLDRCMQAWPTQTPSLSLMPSSPPTKTPSELPSTSLSPSASTSPTLLDCITVTVVYDDYPTETSWKLQSIDVDGTEVEVKSYSEKNGDATSYTETVCLTKGEYEFFIYGICCRTFSGHYNVTTLDGQLIAEGGEFLFFQFSEATRFSIPFVPTPSVSPSPSISPTISSSPTISPSPSMLPSISTSPTGSYCITVSVVYDDFPTDLSWELQGVDLDDTEVEVKSYSEANEDATSHAETVCLTEGEYKFIIFTHPFGLCCKSGEGHYNVTTSDGQLIAEGGEFQVYQQEEETRFSIPFVPAPSSFPSPSPSISPTISSPPTVSPSSSMLPSVSTSPTDTCYWVTVTVVYDDYPTGTWWKLYNAGLDGTKVMVKSYLERNRDATSHTETVCLTEGEYEFIIYDSYGNNGLCCVDGEGHYKVTTLYGQLIADGGDFGWSEVTRFSIPFVPAP